MSQSDEILIYLKKNKNRLLKEYRLTKIGVFGSVAHSKDSEKSDIDLIVEFEKNPGDLYALKQKLREEIKNQFNRPVDICREKYLKPIFKKYIQSETKYV